MWLWKSQLFLKARVMLWMKAVFMNLPAFVALLCVLSSKPFHVIGPFLYPLKISKNPRFSDVFRVYKKRPLCYDIN